MGNILTDKMQDKAMELNENCGDPSNYVCSQERIWRFKEKRINIRLLQLAGESRDADYEAAENFTSTFSKYLEENDINWNDVYNMGKTGLLWKSLPRKVSIY